MDFAPGKTVYQLSHEDAYEGKVQRDRSTSHKYIDEGIGMLCVKALPGAQPGPVGGGRICHPLFKNYEAKVEILETHLKRVTPHIKIL